MAKVGFWLRGAKGKLAGSVLSKGENGTVQRELVTPTNPQTTKQMLQRIAFATVASAAKCMLGVIGQTFEGAGNEKKNRRMFIKENVNRLKQDYIVFNGLFGQHQISPDTSAALPKGLSYLVPNSYIMSKGSLATPLTLQMRQQLDLNENAMVVNSVADPNYSATDDLVTPLQVIKALWGLTPGQQLTVVGIGGVEAAPPIYGEMNADRVVDVDFKAARAVLKEIDEETPIDISGITTSAAFGTFLKKAFDTSKSDATLVSALTGSFELQNDEWKPTSTNTIVGVIGSAVGYDWDFRLAYAAIISEYKNGMWCYNNANMYVKCYQSKESTSYYGLKFPTALPTYMKGSDNTSELFTRQGGTSNSIED